MPEFKASSFAGSGFEFSSQPHSLGSKLPNSASGSGYGASASWSRFAELDLFFLPRFLSTEASNRNGHRLFNHRDTRGFEVRTVMFSFCCFVLV